MVGDCKRNCTDESALFEMKTTFHISALHLYNFTILTFTFLRRAHVMSTPRNLRWLLLLGSLQRGLIFKDSAGCLDCYARSYALSTSDCWKIRVLREFSASVWDWIRVYCLGLLLSMEFFFTSHEDNEICVKSCVYRFQKVSTSEKLISISN